MAPSPVADLQGQTAPCSQAVLEDELAESVLDVKGKEGVSSLWGFCPSDSVRFCCRVDGACHQLQGLPLELGAELGAPDRLSFTTGHHDKV